jgi:hypothetical protein
MSRESRPTLGACKLGLNKGSEILVVPHDGCGRALTVCRRYTIHPGAEKESKRKGCYIRYLTLFGRLPPLTARHHGWYTRRLPIAVAVFSLRGGGTAAGRVGARHGGLVVGFLVRGGVRSAESFPGGFPESPSRNGEGPGAGEDGVGGGGRVEEVHVTGGVELWAGAYN